jgi:hypothetical protein
MSSHHASGYCARTHFLGAHEQQVLYRMRYSRHVLRIAEAPYIDIQGGTRFIRSSVVYEENLKLIGQRDNPV